MIEARQRTWPFVPPDARQKPPSRAAREGNTFLPSLFYGNGGTKFFGQGRFIMSDFGLRF